MFINSCCR